MAESDGPGRTLYHRRSPTRPTHRIRRHHPSQPIQRGNRSGPRNRTPDRTRSLRSHPLRCGHRSHRPRRRRHTHGLRAENKDHPTRPKTGHHPPRRQRMHRRRLSQHPPTPSPPHHPLVTRRNHRPRQSDHTLLVPPSNRRPPTRLPALPPPRPRTDPIPQASPPRATGLTGSRGLRRSLGLRDLGSRDLRTGRPAVLVCDCRHRGVIRLPVAQIDDREDHHQHYHRAEDDPPSGPGGWLLRGRLAPGSAELDLGEWSSSVPPDAGAFAPMPGQPMSHHRTYSGNESGGYQPASPTRPNSWRNRYLSAR